MAHYITNFVSSGAHLEVKIDDCDWSNLNVNSFIESNGKYEFIINGYI